MKKHSKIFIMMLALTMVLASVTTAFADVPDPSGAFYVADYADVIDSDTENYIVSQNGQLESLCDGAQIVILTVDFLDGMNIEDYAYKVFNDWEIGDDKENNGVLLLLTIGEENYWCMRGKGLENDLTAGDLDDILWYNLEDYFAAGDYDSGVKVTFDVLFNELCGIYGVSNSSNNNFYDDGYYDDYYNDMYGDYYEEDLTIFDWIVTLIVLIAIIVMLIFIFKLIRSAFAPARHVQPYEPYRPYTRRPRKVYIPTPVHRPARPTHRPSGWSSSRPFGSPAPRPARPVVPPHRPSSSRPRSSSFGGGRSSFGGGGSRVMGRGGGGMSRGGGAGRRGR